jgi:hypothetical protein
VISGEPNIFWLNRRDQDSNAKVVHGGLAKLASIIMKIFMM